MSKDLNGPLNWTSPWTAYGTPADRIRAVAPEFAGVVEALGGSLDAVKQAPQASPRRKDARLTLSPGAVLPARQAADLLPMADAAARAWLRDRKLIKDLDGREVVIWGQVCEALGQPSEGKKKGKGKAAPRMDLGG